MNPDLPQNEREKLEAQLTSFLLGELPPDETVAFCKAMEQDPELAALYEQLKLTIELVRESAVEPVPEAAPQSVPLKLSEDRRGKLLAQFKTVTPKEFARPRRMLDWLIPIAAVSAMVAILAALLLPALSGAKSRAQNNSVINNLRLLDGAKQQWALENHMPADAEPTLDDLKIYMGRGGGGLPSIAGETYVPGKVSEMPKVETSVAEAKRLFGKQAAITAETRDGKVLVSPLDSDTVQMGQETATLQLTSTVPQQTASVLAQREPQIALPASDQVAETSQTMGDQPNTPPSAGNKFIARNAYIALPPGQALDLGMIQRQTNNAGEEIPLKYASASDISGALAKLDAETNSFARSETTNEFGWYNSPGGTVPTIITGGIPLTGQLPLPHEVLVRGFYDDNLTKESLRREKSTTTLVDADGDGAKDESAGRELKPSAGGGAGGGGAGGNVSVAARPILSVAGKSEFAQVDTNANQAYWNLSNRQAAGSGGTMPAAAPAENGTVASLSSDKTDTAQLVQDGKLMLQMGKLDEAEAKLNQALDRDSNNQAALYYESLAKQSRDRQIVDARNLTSMQRTVKLEQGRSDNTTLEQPGEESVSNAAVVFDPLTGLPVASAPPEGSSTLHTRTFKVDPNQFYAQLQKRMPPSSNSNTSIPKMKAPTGNLPDTGGLRYITSLNTTSEIQLVVGDYFRAQGVDLSGSKSFFFNDRQGALIVRASEKDLDKIEAVVDNLAPRGEIPQADTALPKPAVPPPTPQPEMLTHENAFSTFSLNVSDVSFKLAAASLEKGQMPEPASIRSEEFINAFDYRDPAAAPGVPIAFAAERARYPFAHNRELLRFSLKTAAAGRQAGIPLNIVLLLDNSGSMERADRVHIIQEALRVLAGQLQAQDTFSIVTFARTARLRVDGIPGNQAGAAAEEIAKLTPEGGTNLGDALDLAYETALHHYLANGDNRVVLLTDGAANLGDVNADTLKQKVEAHRKQGVALDCFGIGWEDYNDDLLEVLTRNGDGRYGFINTPEEASTEFVSQIAGALHVAAADVKVQVEFNTNRVVSYRQIGYAKHQLTKEQFRDNTVDAAEIAAQEAGNALYTIEINPQGEGSIATVRVRYKVPGTSEYREQAWDVPYTGSAVSLEQASPAMRLAASASAFSEWLATSPFAAEVSPDQLLRYLSGVPQVYGADTRPAKLEWMLRQAKSISGK